MFEWGEKKTFNQVILVIVRFTIMYRNYNNTNLLLIIIIDLEQDRTFEVWEVWRETYFEF